MDDYAFFMYVADLPELLTATNALEIRLRAAGNTLGADRLLKAYGALRDGLIAMEVQISAEGTKILRSHEEKSRVRPDSLGGGGPRLEDYLHVDPLSTALWGSIGIANETELDAEVPWWSTNEEGSSARIGGVLYGVFEPGAAAPSPTSFREHPLFQSQTGEGAGSGVIKNPIPARRFVEHAIPEIEALWRDAFEALKRAFVYEIDRAQVP